MPSKDFRSQNGNAISREKFNTEICCGSTASRTNTTATAVAATSMTATPSTTMAAMTSTSVTAMASVTAMTPVISRIPPSPRIPPRPPEVYVIRIIVGELFFPKQVYLLDQEIGIAILDLPQLLGLSPHHGAGEGHLAPISIDHAIEKARVEGKEASFGHIGINGPALPIQRRLIDLKEGPLLFIGEIDNDTAQQDLLSRIGVGIFEHGCKGDLRIHLFERTPRDGVCAAG